MDQIVSLEGYSPELREYLLEKRWPELMEVGSQVATLQLICKRRALKMSVYNSTTAFFVVCVFVQALLSGVAVMTPENPWLFIEECLKQLILEEDELNLEW